MIQRCSRKLGNDHITLTQHHKLRKDLVDMGRCLANGAREILHLRQNVVELNEVRRRQAYKLRRLKDDLAQRRIDDWITFGAYQRKVEGKSRPNTNGVMGQMESTTRSGTGSYIQSMEQKRTIISLIEYTKFRLHWARYGE